MLRIAVTSLLPCFAWFAFIASSNDLVAAPILQDTPKKSKGIVTQSDGTPIANATIAPAVFFTENDRNSLLQNAKTETDADGKWEWDHEKYPGVLVVFVRKHGYFTKQVELKANQDNDDIKVVLEDSFRLKGIVLSPDGEPVAGAKVYQSNNNEFGQRSNYFSLSDNGGYYEHVGVQYRKTPIFALASGNLTGYLESADVESFNNAIRLLAPTPFTITVRDPDGAPIPDADVELQSWNATQAIDWRAKTDEEGTVSCKVIPKGNCLFSISRASYQVEWLRSNLEQTQLVATLRPIHRFEAIVIDEDTKEPIEQFICEPMFDRPVPGFHPSETRLESNLPPEIAEGYWHGIEGRNGRFQLESNQAFNSVRFTLHARGYLMHSTEKLSPSQLVDGVTFHMKSHRRHWAELGAHKLFLKNPDGSIASDAQVVLALPTSNFMFHYCELKIPRTFGKQTPQITDEQGMFYFENDAPEELLIAWNQQGMLIANTRDLEPNDAVNLEPYSTVQIEFPKEYVGPLHDIEAKQYLPTRRQRNLISIGIPLEQTDANQSIFLSKRVPSGTILVCDNIRRFNQSIYTDYIACQLETQAGQSYDIQMKGNARLIGKVELDENAPIAASDIEIRAELTHSNDGMDRSYRVYAKPDGTFEFAHVLPGEYNLTCPVTQANKIAHQQQAPTAYYPRILGGAFASVDEGETCDLGELPIKIGTTPR